MHECRYRQLRICRNAITKNLLPMVVLWAASVTAVFGYYAIPSVPPILAPLATKELISLGRSNYAFVGNLQPRDWSEHSRNVFAQTVAAVGGKLSIFENTSAQDFDSFRERLRSWLGALPRPCSLIAANDVTADIVLRLLRNMRIKVPEDVAVIGIDNDSLICENTMPTLTSVAPD